MLVISSLNVNGIRAAQRRGFTDWVAERSPDVICLQELRALPAQVPDPVRKLDYHACLHPAEKKGYAGVGILSRRKPLRVERGMGLEWADREGRLMMAEFDELCVFSLYAPSGTTGDERQTLKMEFLDHFLPLARRQLEQQKPVVFCGDFNICHTAIDIHNPKQNRNTSGFLPEERAWVSRLLEEGYEDIYRNLHPGKADRYSWWSYRAACKERNKGWRIDYHMGSPSLAEAASEAVIEREWDLSDHAPVTVAYEL